MIVRLTTDRTERVDAGSVLQSDRGPMAVRSSRPHQRDWIVQFDGVPDRNAAEALRGLKLRAEPLDDPDALWVHELVGAEVVDAGGVARGRVAGVIPNPADDLLELEGGALVPVTFVVGFEGEGASRVLRIDPPEGLFEI